MNTRENMIIIKGKFKTRSVLSCVPNQLTGKTSIRYDDKDRTYEYNSANVVHLTNPTRLDPKNYEISYGGKAIFNIKEIYSFKGNDKEYWHIIRDDKGKERESDYCTDDLQISKSVFLDEDARTLYQYFLSISEVVSVRSEDDSNILWKKLQAVQFIDEDSFAAVYLRSKEYSSETGLDATRLIFPFGCNESQFKAVTNAIVNRASIIEGPPGTGKTQTILNIIANLIMQDKTVQVVSNNNSAIENVLEKLSSDDYDLGFIGALLGKRKNQERFMDSQTDSYPDLSGWRLSEEETLDDVLTAVQTMSSRIQEIYKDKNTLAEQKQEYSVVQTEKNHMDRSYGNERSRFFRKRLSLKRLTRFRNRYEDKREGIRGFGILFRFVCSFVYGIRLGRLLKADPSIIENCLKEIFYELKLEELDQKIRELEDKLIRSDSEKIISEFKDLSLKALRAKLEQKYPYHHEKRIWKDSREIWGHPEKFVSDYPVVLSTNYCARSNFNTGFLFDYCIMDEASQADIATGALAMASARNVVIVGDSKQLPNVVSEREKIQKITDAYRVPAVYDFNTHSFLQSIGELLGDRISRVILREHYRCHPKIIGFCNQKFYDNQLIIMTEDTDIQAIKVYQSSVGKHSRKYVNQRQIDIIKTEALMDIECDNKDIGIIAPYRDQIRKVRSDLRGERIEINTIHKYQGREKDVIIMSTVLDEVNEFVDDAQLMNVAVSRAKKQFILVSSENEQPQGSNIRDLIDYIRYHNFEIVQSSVRSIFDYLYKDYYEERMQYMKQHGRISEYDSENLMYGLICNLLKEREEPYDVLVGYPLFELITDMSGLSDDERRFINTRMSHVDFLIYNTVTKQPVLAIEVDGGTHRNDQKQIKRDGLKDHILDVCHIPLLRCPTDGSGELNLIKEMLDEIKVDI